MDLPVGMLVIRCTHTGGSRIHHNATYDLHGKPSIKVVSTPWALSVRTRATRLI